MTILETQDLKKYYGTGENTVKALDGVDLKIEVRPVSVQLNGKFNIFLYIQHRNQIVVLKYKADFPAPENRQSFFLQRENILFVYQNLSFAWKTSLDVMGLLKVTSRKFHQTIVMITHNEELAQMADRLTAVSVARSVEFFGILPTEGSQKNIFAPVRRRIPYQMITWI